MLQDSSSRALLLAGLASAVALFTLRRRNRLLEGLRGPESGSFLLGNLPELRYEDEVGDVEFRWFAEYGGAWKIRGILGAGHLLLADPKALQHILQASGYLYPKRTESRVEASLITGEGIFWAEGAQHQKQKKVMESAFATSQLRAFVPSFLRHAERLAQKLRAELTATKTSESPVIDVKGWLSRTTLDVIGDAGLGFEFGALDNSKSPLSEIYENLFIDSTLYPSRWELFYRGLWRFFPTSLWRIVPYTPSREYSRFRNYLKFVRGFSHELLAKSETRENKNIMGLLQRANKDEHARYKMSEREVVEQISTLLIAGHDTTAVTLTWWLWEIAKYPEWQARIRQEIKQVRTRASARADNDAELSLEDLEGMSLLGATIKESMRLHPIVQRLLRKAAQDDVIPLAFPVNGKSGESISAIPISKGQPIDIRIVSYNRHPGIWGDDAHTWRPERFLEDDSRETKVGLYANLMNFAAGVRGCTGWRFSVLEMLAIAIVLLENFEFDLPEQTEKTRIKRKPTLVMMPMAECGLGAWMGLRVRSIS